MEMNKNTNPRMAALLATTALPLLVLSTASQAADPSVLADLQDRDIEEVVVVDKYHQNGLVSATKTPTPVLDVPQSLSFFTSEQISDQALSDIGDILRFTPAATVGQGEGHRDQITIRGQNTTADFFIDGLRDDVEYFRPLYNLERVEILRGANALVFGRGGGGGVVNRVSKTPVLGEDFTAVSSAIDTFGAVTLSGDTNISVSDTAAFRLNAFYESLENHRDTFGGDRFAVNPTFNAKLAEDTRLLLSYEYVNDERTVDRGVPSLNGEPLRGFDDTFFGAEDANETDLEAHIVRARIDHDFSEALTFNTTVQYANYDKLYQNIFPIGFDDSVAGQAPLVTLDGYRDATERENLIIQSNFVADFDFAGVSHTLLFGGEYAIQNSDNNRRDVVFDSTGTDQVSFLFSDPLVVPSFGFPGLTRDTDSDVTVLSFYAQDQIDVGKHFKIVGGVRYDRFEIDVLDILENTDGDANNGLTGRVDTEWSPRVGFIYKPEENVSFYASYSRSFLPRSGNQFVSLSPTNAALAPEQFDNYEAGLKWDITPGLSLTTAIFRLDREGGTTVDPDNVDRTIIIGSRTEGFEAQLVGEILPGWSLNAGYSYLDGDERGRVVDGALANRTLSQVPEHLFSLWNRVEVTEKLSFGVGATYQDEQFASISNAVELPDFIRFDAAVYYQLSDDVKLQLNVENLFNADYFPAAHNDNNISTGEPLNARLSISARF